MAIDNSNTNSYDSNESLSVSVFKKIKESDVTLNSFQVNKLFTVTSGSLTSSCLPLEGFYTSPNNILSGSTTFNTDTNIDGSYKYLIYRSINKLFYANKNNIYYTFGQSNLAKTSKKLFQSASILSFPYYKIGEEIKPGSFTLNVNETGSVYGKSIISNIDGNLIETNIDSGSFVDNEEFYEGFNEYFDVTRIPYTLENVNYIPGVTSSDGDNQPIGYAAQFNGSGYIKTDLTGYYDRDNDYSISFFIKLSTATAFYSNDVICTKSDSHDDIKKPFHITLNSFISASVAQQKVNFEIKGSSTKILNVTSSALTIGTWNHIVCEKSQSFANIYVNNILINSSSAPWLDPNINTATTSSVKINNTSSLHIGGYDTNSFNLTGDLDEIRIYNKTLTDSNIRSLNNRSITGSMLQTNVIGNVFEDQGIVTISSPNYIYNNILNENYTSSYRSTITLHELNTIVRVNKSDFNVTTNTSILKDDQETIKSFATGSVFSPYITTIGLYNDMGELLALGKLGTPIKKKSDIDINFLIRLDLDKNLPGTT